MSRIHFIHETNSSFWTRPAAIKLSRDVESEVVEAIRNEEWRSAEGGRLECRRNFLFNAAWNEKRYVTKQVRPIFVEEADEIVVVTVYVYYF